MRVGTDHGTIQECIDAAAEAGNVEPVIVPPGRYRENLDLLDGTRLVAEIVGEVVVQPADAAIPVVSGAGVWPAIIDGIEFVGPGLDTPATACSFEASVLRIVNCRVAGFTRGLVFEGCTLTEIAHCDIEHCLNAVYSIQSAELHHHCRYRRITGHALSLYASDAAFEYNIIGPARGGYLALSGGMPIFRNNVFFDCSERAGFSGDEATPIARNNAFVRTRAGLIVGVRGGLINSHNGFVHCQTPFAYGSFREGHEPELVPSQRIAGTGTRFDHPGIAPEALNARAPIGGVGVASAVEVRPRDQALVPAAAAAGSDRADTPVPEIAHVPTPPPARHPTPTPAPAPAAGNPARARTPSGRHVALSPSARFTTPVSVAPIPEPPQLPEDSPYRGAGLKRATQADRPSIGPWLSRAPIGRHAALTGRKRDSATMRLPPTIEQVLAGKIVRAIGEQDQSNLLELLTGTLEIVADWSDPAQFQREGRTFERMVGRQDPLPEDGSAPLRVTFNIDYFVDESTATIHARRSGIVDADRPVPIPRPPQTIARPANRPSSSAPHAHGQAGDAGAATPQLPAGASAPTGQGERRRRRRRRRS